MSELELFQPLGRPVTKSKYSDGQTNLIRLFDKEPRELFDLGKTKCRTLHTQYE
jgi:hypothetical protein